MAQIIKSSGDIIEIEPKNGKEFSLKELQEIVDGYIDIVRLNDGRYMVVNDEGLINDLPVNFETSIMYYRKIDILRGSCICGDVLICESNQIS